MKKARKHDEPSAESLREIPEADFSKEKWERRPGIAARIAAEGMTFPGRGRPKKGQEVGPSVLKSVRLPESYWKALERRAKREKLSLHAAIRVAIARYVGRT
jgi:hypothetical protein